MGTELASAIRTLAETPLQDKGQYVVDVVVSDRRLPKKILVILDGDKDVTIDDCALLSRHLTDKLDEQLLPDAYRLEVSSPGLDQPLKLTRQYRKNVGRQLRVTVDAGLIEGELISANEMGIILRKPTKKKEETTSSINLSYNQILKAFVLPTFK